MSRDEPGARSREHIKTDRFAIFDVAREFQLSAMEAWLLDVLVRLAAWQTAEWRGHLYELAEHSLTGRTTVAGAGKRVGLLDRLVSHGLIEIVEPFGKNREGRIFVAVYDELVVQEPRRSPQMTRRHASNGASVETSTRVEHGSSTRRIRVEHASNGANEQEEQGSARERGSERVRSQGDEPRGDCGRPERSSHGADHDEVSIPCSVPGCHARGEWDNEYGELVCEAHGRGDDPGLFSDFDGAPSFARSDPRRFSR